MASKPQPCGQSRLAVNKLLILALSARSRSRVWLKIPDTLDWNGKLLYHARPLYPMAILGFAAYRRGAAEDRYARRVGTGWRQLRQAFRLDRGLFRNHSALAFGLDSTLPPEPSLSSIR